MERVLQISIVTALLMLLIWRSIRGREERFRRFSYLFRLRPPLAEEVRQRWVAGIFQGTGRGEGGSGEVVAERDAFGIPADADAWLLDEDSRLLLMYWLDGKLTIARRGAGGRNRVLQELSVPLDCSALGWDALERRIYLEEGGDWFVYGEEE